MPELKEQTRTALEKLHLLDLVQRSRRLLAREPVAMKFPSYETRIQRIVAQSSDYVRYASMALAIHRLQEERIPGDFAEVGVYRGVTSRFLSECAPERTLFLFDTFDGFPDEDREPVNDGDERFRDTSLSQVERALRDRPGVVFRKGRFPETARGLEDRRFAFVLLDLDVFQPTLAGLEYFYPRMTRGGYCFVHDFNSPESNAACHRAVERFLQDKPELPVEVADRWGSAVFRRI